MISKKKKNHKRRSCILTDQKLGNGSLPPICCHEVALRRELHVVIFSSLIIAAQYKWLWKSLWKITNIRVFQETANSGLSLQLLVIWKGVQKNRFVGTMDDIWDIFITACILSANRFACERRFIMCYVLDVWLSTRGQCADICKRVYAGQMAPWPAENYK